MDIETLGYNPDDIQKEKNLFYIGVSPVEQKQMLDELNLSSLTELFSWDESLKLDKTDFKNAFGEHLEYKQLLNHLLDISKENKPKLHFLNNLSSHWNLPSIIQDICKIRGLTTAYTPYQPERSQGTLQTLWIYQNLISELTKIEAINASLYDGGSALYETILCAKRLMPRKKHVLIDETLPKACRDVISTLARDTDITIHQIKKNNEQGVIDFVELDNFFKKYQDDIVTLAFPQVNCFGLLNNVDYLTDWCSTKNILSTCFIDPILLGTGGLKPPGLFGSKEQGVDLIAGEASHLALSPNFGGPKLGVFGIRFHDKNKKSIRQAPGRFVGKTTDIEGTPCLTMVLSTREQHIRREKATSNICSNQSFLSTLIGACLLTMGDEGLKISLEEASGHARYVAKKLCSRKGIRLKFPKTPFFNSLCLELDQGIEETNKRTSLENINPFERFPDTTGNEKKDSIIIHFTNRHSKQDIEKLLKVFDNFKNDNSSFKIPSIEKSYLRKYPTSIPKIQTTQLISYYQRLGELNFSPDQGVYPLGSCTMKYNPYINDYAASLKGFTDIHPDACLDDVQGGLKILYRIQEFFLNITGLDAVTTQPVAGAQGELVGLKMIRAFHRDNGENRDIILIPRSSHGTNPATAVIAGFHPIFGQDKGGIYFLSSKDNGEIDLNELKSIVDEFGPRICGIMITNPNTAGILESQFPEIAKIIHEAGGLVYMDGANMNAIAGQLDLKKIGVDAVHNNLHKTWSIPHGGGGPGDAIVAVSNTLRDYLPGKQIVLKNHKYHLEIPKKSIGTFHPHFGNFAHKVRCYTYLKALGHKGIVSMSCVAVLSARYLLHKLEAYYPTLPSRKISSQRLHEFIITLPKDLNDKILENHTQSLIISQVGKLFLDFGFHAPTVSFPEPKGLMIEPTESFSKKELDRFLEVLVAIANLIRENPNVLKTAPHLTPILKVDEVAANRHLNLNESVNTLLKDLPKITISPNELHQLPIEKIVSMIKEKHNSRIL